MRHLLLLVSLLAPVHALAQHFLSSLVQPPELSAPQRGSLAGQYSRTAFGPADLSRGGFRLDSPFAVPTERGPLLANPFPTYSPDSGISEWGLGWQSQLTLTRWRVRGELDYLTDELTGPWGHLVQGSDGSWYPQGLKGFVRVAQTGDTFVAHLPDGSRWTFGGPAQVHTPRGTYAWHLTQVDTPTNQRAQLTWTANASGRLFLESVTYGGVGGDFQYRVSFSYEDLPTPFLDYRPGHALQLDRRVSHVTVLVKHAKTGLFTQRWSYTLGYRQEAPGPAFFLTSVQQLFASGERMPAVTFEYEPSATVLQVAALRPIPRFDAVLRTFSDAIAMPDRSTPLDRHEDGLVDLENHSDFTLIVQGPESYTTEPLPPPPPGARQECRPAPSATNLPRPLARMRAGSMAYQVVSLTFQEPLVSTALLLCERDGRLVHQTSLPERWELGATTRLVDLNRDRQPDLIHVFEGGYQIIPNLSTEEGYAFGALRGGPLHLDFEPQALWVHDFNGDSVADLVVRFESLIAVYPGRGGFLFEQEPWLFPAQAQDGTPVDISRFELSFVDANHDGLTDVILAGLEGAFLLVNTGTRLVDQLVPGLLQAGPAVSLPIVQDFAGSGNTEVFFLKEGQAHSVALDTPGTGLLRAADDGKGTRLRFEYARSPAVTGQRQRNALLSRMTMESSGSPPISFQYAYGEPRIHSEGEFLLGYERVTRQGPQSSEEMRFLHEDRFAGVLLASRTRDTSSPLVETFESLEYDEALFQGVPWKRLREREQGWRSADGTQRLSERQQVLAYASEVCPSLDRLTHEHGTLTTERTRASIPKLAGHLHCLESHSILTGTHQDASLDFRYEGHLVRNSEGLVLTVQSVAPGGARLVLQSAEYNPDSTLARLTRPGQGTTAFGYEPSLPLLRQVTTPDGVVLRAMERDPVTDSLLALETERGAHRFHQLFRHDGLERLAKQWTSFGGTAEKPLQTFSYRYATATTPASVASSTLVDEALGARRDTIEYTTATGEPVTLARRIPEGWAFDAVSERDPSNLEVRTGFRSTLPPTVDVRALDYATLLAGVQPVARTRSSTFGHGVAASALIHEGVERQETTTLELKQGRLKLTTLENNTFRTTRFLDASQRLVAYEDEADTHHGYRYDALGRLRQVDLPDGKTHVLQYDGHGRVSRVERKGIARVEYAYAPTSGLLDTKRFLSPEGLVQRQVRLTYDSAGRLSAETYSDGTHHAPMVYRYFRDGATPDHPAVRAAPGFLTAITGPGFSKRFEHRADGSLLRRILSLDGWRTVETRFAYAADGAVTLAASSVKSVDGQQLSSSTHEYRWSAHGRLAEEWLNGGRLATFGYDGNGLPKSAAFSSGDTVTLGYDARTRQLVSVVQAGAHWQSSTSQVLNDREFVETESFATGASPPLQRHYSYAPQGFLSSATDPGNTYVYGFDAFGLSRSIQKAGVKRDFVTQGNSLTVGGVKYTFDRLGRAVTRGALAFEYGPDGQLARATRGSSEWRFLYDEAGQRLLKVAQGAPSAAYLESGALLEPGGLIEPVSFGGQLVGLINKGTFQMLAADTRGTVIADTDGTVRLASPFGERAVHPSTAAVLDYVRQGYDADLGLVRMGVRDYDPELNRFLTPDPLYLEAPERCLASPLGCNLYGYANANPLRYSDPSGQDTDDVLAGGAKGLLMGLLPGGALCPVPENQHPDYYTAYSAMMTLAGLIEVTQGTSMIGGGGVLIVGGSVAAPTGVGTAPGGAAIGLGTVMNVVGVALAVNGTASLAKAAQVGQMAGGNGSSAQGGAGSNGFGNLSEAAEYGIKPYNELRKELKGTDLQAHHLIEKRFSDVMVQEKGQMASMAVTPLEHQAFTNQWRAAIPYGAGTQAATKHQVLSTAKDIYKNYPAILTALGL